MRLRFATRTRRGAGAGSAPEGEPTTRAVQTGGPPEPETDATNGRDAAHEPSAPELTPVANPPAPVIIPRWVQLVLLPIALLAVWALARAAKSVVLILIVASLVALILAPWVRRAERRLPRGLAILSVYIAMFAIIAGIGVVLVSPVTTQITHFENNLPALTRDANRDLSNFQSFLDRHGINVHIEKQGQTALDTLQKDVLKRSGDIVSFSRGLLSSVVTTSFDLVLILVLSIYMLVYGREIGGLARRIMPTGDGSPEDDYPLLVQHAVSGYVRGQLLFSLIMGTSAALVLAIFGLLGIFHDGERYAVFFGAFYGLMEFIPYIGPIIGPVPAVVVALFQSPISAVWLILAFIALQQLEGHVVAPQVFRISLRINPILIILALLIGYQLYGVPGALVALPVIAVIRQTVLYLRRHVVLEPWHGTAGPGAGLMTAGSQRCPECGEPALDDEAYCGACGAPLEPPVGSPR
jgi:predicted PurR-regulated permease PerM